MSSKKSIQFLLSIGAAIYIGGCANKIKPTGIPLTANPTAEIDSLATELSTARAQNADVLAPESFKSAENRLKDAREKQANGKKGEKILEDVGYARAYLKKALEATPRAQNQMADVMKARDQAISGGAEKNHHEEMVKLDNKLKKYTVRIEGRKMIDRSDVTELQQEYLDLELKAIKNAKLSEARNTLDSAEKQGAKSITPKAFQESVEKLSVAEKSIETDRHNTSIVDGTAMEATESARRTLTLVQTAKENKNRSPEQVAREIEERNLQLVQASALNTAAQADAAAKAAQMSSKDQQLVDQRAQLGAQLNESEKEKANLEKREQFNRVFEEARAEFNKDEAEVYRQGDNMIIRLKSMKFSPGPSELPSASMAVLSKVKGVVGQLKTEDIVIEGHTDSTGSAEINKRLSTERASAVADYFKAENTIPAANVESIGYGYEKPIASNKSKSGREMNRRVDIVIKPITATNSTDTDSGTSSKQ